MSDSQGANLLGSDIKLADYDLGADLQIGASGDMTFVSEELNLAQAILHRLRTVKGELAELGHPEYGSNIFNFIGQPNDWMTRSRLRLAIRDAIRQERRVKEITNISVTPRLQNLGAQSGKAASKSNVVLATTAQWDQETDGEPIDEDSQASGKQVFPDSTEILNSVDVEIVIIPQGAAKPVQIAFPFNLEGS